MKMLNLKKSMFVSFAAVTLLGAVACSESDDKNLTAIPSKIEIEDFSISVAQGDSTLQFYAADNWTATLSTTSWIEIDPMTKVGGKGDSKVILKWKESTGIKERSTELTISVANENPVRIKITQLPNKPVLILDREESVLKIDKNGAKGRGLFTDTMTINSNIKWTVKEKPSWIEYTFVDGKESQDGVPTTVRVVLSGSSDMFDKEVMADHVVFGAVAADDNNQSVSVKAVSEMVVVASASESDNTPISKIVMKQSGSAGGRFVAQVVVKTNTGWILENIPEWAEASALNNATEYGKYLITQKPVSIVMKDESLDTDKMAQTVIFRDEKTGLRQEVEIIFPGTGNDYFESKLALPLDFSFHASRFNPDWSENPEAILSFDFDMVSAKDYQTIEEAPFNIYFLKSQNGFLYKEEVYWANVDFAENQLARTALNVKRLTLFVSDRNMGMEENKIESRQAYMVVAPKNVSFDDLFIPGTEDLKEEYPGTLIAQSGIALVDPETDIPDVVSFEKEGGEQFFTMTAITQYSFVVRDFSKPADAWDAWTEFPTNDWISYEVENDDQGNAAYLTFKAAPNETNKKREYLVRLTEYRTATEEEFIVKEFTVSQLGE
ncbi:MAG: hypothetical protein RR346_06815 [Bacteroidales bacterium]